MVDPADKSLFNPGVKTPLLTKSKGYNVAEAANPEVMPTQKGKTKLVLFSTVFAMALSFSVIKSNSLLASSVQDNPNPFAAYSVALIFVLLISGLEFPSKLLSVDESVPIELIASFVQMEELMAEDMK